MTEELPNDKPRENEHRGVSSGRSQTAQGEKYARLRAEAAAPYRGLRKFIYITFGASGFIGAFIFLTQLLAGREVDSVLPNLALQLGVVALMVWLYQIDGRTKRKAPDEKARNQEN
jgi:hypothetical protein